MTSQEDDALIVRCAQDPSAFRQLVGLYQGRVYGFLVNFAGRDAADDLFQETWLRVLKAAPRYEARGLAGAWIMRIARGAALNDIEKRGPSSRFSGEDAAERLPDPAPTPAIAFEKAALKERVEAALATLPPEQREVFLLKEVGGLAYREIAEELGIPLGTALSRMNYALKKLRATLGESHE